MIDNRFEAKHRLQTAQAFLFGLDGCLIDTYAIHLDLAEREFRQQIERRGTTTKPPGFYATIYLKTSGQPTRDQYAQAYKAVHGKEPNSKETLRVENQLNKKLTDATKSADVFAPAAMFLRLASQKLPPRRIVSTSHLLSDAETIVVRSDLSKYIDNVLCNGGVISFTKNNIERIVSPKGKEFKKGRPYREFIEKTLHISPAFVVAFCSTIADIKFATGSGFYTIALPLILSKYHLRKLRKIMKFNTIAGWEELCQLLRQ